MTTGLASVMTARLRRPARPAGWPAFAPVLIGGLVLVIWVAYVRPLAHFDIDVFLRAGAAVEAGRDPYPSPGSPAVSSGFAFVYPYLVAIPFVPLAWLPRAGAEGLFIGLSVLAVLAGCRLAGARRWQAYALVLVASCTITGLQMGTLNALLFAGLAALWRLRDRPVAAGLLAALLVYSKLFLAPLPLWLLLTGRWRATAAAAGALVALFGVGQAVSPMGLTAYSGMLDALARAEAPDGLSLTGLLMNAGLGLGAATWAARALAATLIAGCWLAVRRRRTPPASAVPAPDAGQDRLLFTATVAAALLASPIVWSHYLLLLAVPLLVVEGGERTGALAVATAVSWLLVTPHLSTPPEIAVSAVVVALLVAAPLRDALRRQAGRRGPARAPGTGALGLARDLAPWVVGVAAITAAGLELCWALARAHHGRDAVTGAYLATVAVLALLAWGAHRTLRSGVSSLPSTHRSPSRPAGQVT
ncbi:glycosyltransferase 87 family protein [Pseudofrankia sp. DC12]|uniref:glycosyltransferase 87 family protein n=1 Tax=Pseudofrankia sp. DC12 TaxID=683315 RepID=UPI000698A7A5|nr:glycosyltransferase 87 family protein [Pseudofrankia sp. DC12]